MVGVPIEYIFLTTKISMYYATWNHLGYVIKNKFVSKLFITPHDHAIHHEKNIESQRSNYGNIFSIFDQLFKTYKTKTCTQIYGRKLIIVLHTLLMLSSTHVFT